MLGKIYPNYQYKVVIQYHCTVCVCVCVLHILAMKT
jgi:hypothetical protein